MDAEQVLADILRNPILSAFYCSLVPALCHNPDVAGGSWAHQHQHLPANTMKQQSARQSLGPSHPSGRVTKTTHQSGKLSQPIAAATPTLLKTSTETTL